MFDSLFLLPDRWTQTNVVLLLLTFRLTSRDARKAAVLEVELRLEPL